MASGILYAAVGRPATLLVSHQRSDGDYESRTKSFLSSYEVTYDTKTCFQSELVSYHILVKDSLIYICVTDSNSGKSVPYEFLSEIQKKFTSGSLAVRAWNAMEHEFDRDFCHVLEAQMIKYSSQEALGTVGQVRGQVNEVIGVMKDNIAKVVDRGEKLDTLIDKTNELEVSSGQFRSTSKKVRRKMMCKNMKMWFIIIFLLAAIITIIALISTNVIPLKS